MATPNTAAVEKLLRQLAAELGYGETEEDAENFVCQMAAAADAVKISIADENKDDLHYDAIPELADTLATDVDVPWRNARGLTATTRMIGARNNRERILRERNEVIAVLAHLWDAHTMPPDGRMNSLDRRVVCIESPAKQLCWPITAEEQKEHFADLPKLKKSDWDKTSAAERSTRLAELCALVPKLPAARKGAKPTPAQQPPQKTAVEAPRRPGEFHRPRK